jgi:hypothetical protein
VRSTQVPEQLVWPLGHWHEPLKHCVPPVHFVPQVPQLSGSDWVSVQPMLHALKPVEQVAVHALDEQTWVPVHFVPHAPQLSGSFVVSTQAPAQSTAGALHAALPPVPVVVVPPVPVDVAPPVPVDVAPPVPVDVAPPAPVVPVPVVVVVPVVAPVPPVPVDVAPPELLPQPAAVPAKMDAQRSEKAIDR